MNDKTNTGQEQLQFNLYTILKDLQYDWLAILLITISVGIFAYVGLSFRYHPVYQTTATMVVTNSGVNNNAYQNLYAASETAEKFSQLVNSSTMQRIVARDMGLDGFKGTASATYLEDSNLIQLTVVSDTPELSFLQMNAILNNYADVSRDLLGDINVTLLSSPEVPKWPTIPFSPGKWVLFSMMLAFAGVTALLAVLSSLRDTIRVPDDVEAKLDTKLLSTISHEEKNKNLRSKIDKKRQKTSILISDPVTSFRYVEEIKRLASRITNRMTERHGKVMLITSLLENEGKSTVAANLSLALAEEGKKVLLVDADFRNPAIYKVLNMRGHEFTNLTDVLKNAESLDGIDDIKVSVPGTKLYTLLNRQAVSSKVENVSNELLKGLVYRYAKEMDYIIVDTPPMGLVADAEEIAPFVDGCILVVRQHMADARDLNDAIDALNGGHHRLLGCVFNNVYSSSLELPTSTYGYAGGYGQGGKYGE